MSMSDPLLPVPDPDARDRERRPLDGDEPDVLEGPADGAEEDVATPAETAFRTPAAGDGLTTEQLREDLQDD